MLFRSAVAEGFEPSIAGLTIRCLTNLATPQEEGEQEKRVIGQKAKGILVSLPRSPFPLFPISVGGDEGSRTLIVRFTRPTLCYPVELHRQE